MQKNILIPLSIIIASAVIGGVLIFSGGDENNSLGVNTAQANLRKVDLEIKNMFCVGCSASVVNSVKALPGVVEADADPSTDSGWIIYDGEQITKEEIILASIFQSYPARILDDQVYSDSVEVGQSQTIPPEIEQKLNLLAQKLQERGVKLEQFLQDELDEAISGGYWGKVDNILNNFLRTYEQN